MLDLTRSAVQWELMWSCKLCSLQQICTHISSSRHSCAAPKTTPADRRTPVRTGQHVAMRFDQLRLTSHATERVRDDVIRSTAQDLHAGCALHGPTVHAGLLICNARMRNQHVRRPQLLACHASRTHGTVLHEHSPAGPEGSRSATTAQRPPPPP